MAALFLAAVLVAWPAVGLPVDAKYYFGAPPNLIRLPEAVVSFLTFAVLAAASVAAAAVWSLRNRPRLPIRTTGLLALGGAATPLLALVVAYLRVTQFGTGVGFSFAGAVLAAGFAF